MADKMADKGATMAYGDGTKPHERKDGYWVATVEAGFTERGTRRRKSVVAKTEPECKRKLRDLRREMLAGTATSVDPRMTVKRYADIYLADYATHARPRTQETTGGSVRRWIVPSMGNRKLTELGVGDLRKLERDMHDGGVSATTIANVRSVLGTMLRAAVREGYRVPEPVLKARKPRAALNDRRAMTVEDAARLLRYAADHDLWPELPAGASKDDRARRTLALESAPSRWVAALLQGMRQGECLGLTWDAVDFAGGTLDVSWQLQRIPSGTSEPPDYEVRWLVGRYALVRPKSVAGQRLVPLVPWMAEALQIWRKECPETPWGLVWPRVSGMPWRAADDREAWYGLQEAAGVIRQDRHWLVHENRHTTVSVLLALGVPAEVIMAIAGHASLASSAAYKHVDLTQARAALEGVAGRLGLTA